MAIPILVGALLCGISCTVAGIQGAVKAKNDAGKSAKEKQESDVKSVGMNSDKKLK